MDGTAFLWDARTGAYLHRLNSHTHFIPSVTFAPAAFSSDGKLVLTGTIDGKVFVWDARTGAFKRYLCPVTQAKS